MHRPQGVSQNRCGDHPGLECDSFFKWAQFSTPFLSPIIPLIPPFLIPPQRPAYRASAFPLVPAARSLCCCLPLLLVCPWLEAESSPPWPRHVPVLPAHRASTCPGVPAARPPCCWLPLLLLFLWGRSRRPPWPRHVPSLPLTARPPAPASVLHAPRALPPHARCAREVCLLPPSACAAV